ncbi:MAG: hypothetical protein AAF391_01245 [Bacteroidota bacterium]
MNKQLLLYLAFLFAFLLTMGQTIPTKKEILDHYGFEEHTLVEEQKEVLYYTYSTGEAPKTKLIMFLQGSHPSPQFSYQIKDGENQYLCWLHREFTKLPAEYLYVVVEKPGFEGVFNEDKIDVPQVYYEKNSLDLRVTSADLVLRTLASQHNLEKMIVYGHSEGAPVAAKLATVNQDISHLGFWAGNALPDFYDFILEGRFRVHAGEETHAKAQKDIDRTISHFVNEIAKNPTDTKKDRFGYTNKRWASYAEPPINNLLKLDIPVFVQVATNDESAPIESTYLIPLEFARLGNDNLSYNICIDCDHGFYITDKKGNRKSKWNEIFNTFLKWTETN